MASKFFKAAFQFGKTVTKKLKGNKAKNPQAIKSVPVGKNLAKKRFHQDDIIKTREKVMTEYGIKDPKTRTALRTKANQPKINKKIADIQDRARVKKMGFNEYKKSLREKKMGFNEYKKSLREKKMGGGMMGRRMGYSKGKLVGNQKKIDVAAPFGKITGEDFKKLRARKR